MSSFILFTAYVFLISFPYVGSTGICGQTWKPCKRKCGNKSLPLLRALTGILAQNRFYFMGGLYKSSDDVDAVARKLKPSYTLLF